MMLGDSVREILDRWERLEKRSLGLSVIQAVVDNLMFVMNPRTGLAVISSGAGQRCPRPEERAAFEAALTSGKVQIVVVHHLTQRQLVLHEATGNPLGSSKIKGCSG